MLPYSLSPTPANSRERTRHMSNDKWTNNEKIIEKYRCSGILYVYQYEAWWQALPWQPPTHASLSASPFLAILSLPLILPTHLPPSLSLTHTHWPLASPPFHQSYILISQICSPNLIVTLPQIITLTTNVNSLLPFIFSPCNPTIWFNLYR